MWRGRQLKMPPPDVERIDIVTSNFDYYGARIGTMGADATHITDPPRHVFRAHPGGNIIRLRAAQKYVVDVDEAAAAAKAVSRFPST